MTHRSYTQIARHLCTALLAILALTLLPIDRSVSQDGPPPPLPQPTEAFYKRKTGLTPKAVSGSYTFSVIKGESGLFPDHGVIVEPNKMLPPPAKRAISVIKKV